MRCCSNRFTKTPLALLALAVLTAFVAPTAALAQGGFVQMSAGPIYTSPLTVGASVPAAYSITNNSSGAVSINTASTDNKIRYVPACRTTNNLGANDPALMCVGAGDQDAGVFSTSATGTGTPTPDAVGVSGCNSTLFTFTPTGDAAGTILISSAAPIVLPQGYTCTIAFTLNVLAVPTNDAVAGGSIQTIGLGNVNTTDGATLVADNSVTGGGTGSTNTTVFACPPGGACCPDGYFAPATTICRPSAGVCDVAESCPGNGPACPADGFVAATTECRASAGVCDVAESCPGDGPACPADGFVAATTECRASAGVCDVAESCPGNGPACPPDGFQPSTTVCNPDLCQSCTGNSATCSTTDLCVEEACRTPGFFATHAGEEKNNSINITSMLIQSAPGGQISICGEPIVPYLGAGNTGVDHNDSPVEALCQANKGDFRSQVVFHLTAASLNCLANGKLPDCSNSPLFGAAFAACNVPLVCAPTSDANKDAQALCVATLDCLNNGGHPVPVNGGVFCSSGTCSDNDAPCTPSKLELCADPSTATCNPLPNCHTLDLPGYPNPGAAGSPKACNDAEKTACTIFSPICPVP